MSATMEMKEVKKDGIVQDQAVVPLAEASQTRPSEEEPPLPYTRRETWFIVLIIAVAGLFRDIPAHTTTKYLPFLANIYFPAIPTLTGVFHKSTSDLNLTVTVYLILQGICKCIPTPPMIWGPVSDFYGRRPTYLICFIILVMSCLGLALVPTNAFWLLLLLRCLQSAGCSSTTALGSGVIGDISHRKDRGGYYSAFNLGPQVAPVVGPILGGALAGGLGWRSIFWFLFILSSSSWLFLLCFLPETRRTDVASRNAFTKLIYTPIIPVVKRSQASIDSAQPTTTSSPPTPKRTRIRNPLPLFLNPAVSLALAFTAVIYSVWYCVTATISSAFAAKYPFLTEADVGLCYLPIGVGMFLSSAVHGRILDAEGVGYTFNVVLNTTMTLMIDIEHSQSSSVTACTNLARCSLAAVLTAVIDHITSAVGYGWTYVLFGGLSLLMIPLIYLEILMGPRWRARREARKAKA
ncbi:major facilitator superfamily domain-containing protein [Schizophyllum commune]